jgi:hypothetical protein
MKSAYELAMERLNQAGPNEAIQLTEDQKEELADLDNKYNARVAEKRISLNKKAADARAQRDFQAAANAQEELRIEIERIESDRESAKNRVRTGKQQGA